MTPEPHPTAREALANALEQAGYGGPEVEQGADAILAALASEGWTLVPQSINRCEHGAIKEPCVPCSEARAAERERLAAREERAAIRAAVKAVDKKEQDDPIWYIEDILAILDSRSTTGGAE